MFYDTHILFLQKILNQYNIESHLMPYQSGIPAGETEIRNYIYERLYDDKKLAILRDQLKQHVIYQFRDFLGCQYYILRIPDTEPEQLFFAGPYSDVLFSHDHILQVMKRLNLSPAMEVSLNIFYQSIPLIADTQILFALFRALGEILFQEEEYFTFETLDMTESIDVSGFLPKYAPTDQEETAFQMQRIEEIYQAENDLLDIVSRGMIHQTEFYTENIGEIDHILERRLPDSIRNLKNYCIILNTLLRKAAEKGSVHPYHIDHISSEYARKIELIHSLENGRALVKEMIRKYCLLVRNHSMKHYTLPVQKVMLQVDSQLTGDLSLKAMAEMLQINASYLSTLFKKETGVTLTDYVNKKRIDHAILLLNSSNGQIQDIAQSCGISDVNYFTKLFKKYIGKTPKEYREMIRGH